jgi:hypothetical protein
MSIRQASFPAALAALIVIPLGIQLARAVHVLPSLERAVAQQCRTHDWPADKHQVHMDWCADNGYATN